jgi:hypothetical protein
MRILYGAGRTSGSNLQLGRFMENADHEIKVMANVRNHRYLPYIDWSLDALYGNNKNAHHKVIELFGHPGLPILKYELISEIMDDLAEWGPELVISEAEPISAHIAKTFDIPLWYCSPLYLLFGVEWLSGSRIPFKPLESFLFRLPKGNRYFIYSPFCNVIGRPRLKPGFEWIKPYYKNKSECSTDLIAVNSPGFSYLKAAHDVITGETSLIADRINKSTPFFISPNSKDYEEMLNATIAEKHGIAPNLGEIRNDVKLAKRKVEKLNTLNYYLNKQQHSFLHERIANV